MVHEVAQQVQFGAKVEKYGKMVPEPVPTCTYGPILVYSCIRRSRGSGPIDSDGWGWSVAVLQKILN